MYRDRLVPKRPEANRLAGVLRTGPGVLLLALACISFLAGPMPASADPGPGPGDQGRASATRGSSGSHSSGSSASSGRTSVSRSSGGSGGAARTRPGGGGGGRTTANRPPSSSHGGRHPGHVGFHGRYFFPDFGFSYFRYPYYLGFRGYPYGYYGYPGVAWYDYQAYPTMGGIDLNVHPKKAEVYIDGQRIGRVGRFDGYPSVLWLEEGTYELVIYHPGFQTFHETVKVFAGVVIDLDQDLVPGEATPPEEIVPPPSPPPEPVAQDEPSRAPRSSPGDVDLRREPARLHLTVEPRDASVYLDGRFLGTGDELAELRSGLMVNPGEHHLSVVRPSFDSEELTVDVAPGEDLDLAVRLDRTGGAG